MPGKTPTNATDQQFNDIVARFASELRELMAAQVLEAVRHSVGEILASGLGKKGAALEAPAPQQIVVSLPRVARKPTPEKAATAAKKPAAKKPSPSKAPASPAKSKAKPAEASGAKKPTLTVNEAKRIAGTKPVACPVPGCTTAGVRKYSNFCVDHHASVPKAEQKKLRDAQRKAQAEAQQRAQREESASAA